MSLIKQPLLFNFAGGLNLKTDKNQVNAGAFLSLQNSVFDVGGRLTKRNGFAELSVLSGSASYLTTFADNLTAVGSSLNAYSANTETWENRGTFIPLSLNTLALVRNSLNQIQADSVVYNGMVCTAYTETDGTNTFYKYVVADAITGQVLISPAAIVPIDSGSVEGSLRVFAYANHFVVMFLTNVSGSHYLQYFGISTLNLAVGSTVDLVTNIAPAYDGIITNGVLVVCYAGNGAGLFAKTIGQNLAVQYSAELDNTTSTLSLISLSQQVNNDVAVSYYDPTNTKIKLCVFTVMLFVLSTTTLVTGISNIVNLALSDPGPFYLFYEVLGVYGYDSSIPNNSVHILITDGFSTISNSILNGIGLASKATVYNNEAYVMVAYQSLYQPSLFLINGQGAIASSLAYENAGGMSYDTTKAYYSLGLPSLLATGSSLQAAYLYKDLIAPVNKGTNVSGVQIAGIYAQLGVNLTSFDLAPSEIISSEIGANLNISGGFLWAYDGQQLTENGFFLWPDYIEVSTATGSGNITAGTYYYQVIYTSADNQGNIFRSAPSIPVAITTTTTQSTNTIHIPTLRLTHKTLVKIEIYRWSLTQQTYYEITSVSQPLLNNPSVAYVTFTDTYADSTIIGNAILYTNGGTVEDVAAPANVASSLFDDRLWLIDAEDQNLLWFSKQVLQATPVEMSDLFTFYVAPSIGAQGSTGPLRCLAPMDDKLILFKDNAIYYINGSGPDNTGSQNNYTGPLFITATIGCSNQNSIVFTPAGLMFQSNKGIWLLGRDLSTQYIGAPVEGLTTFSNELGIQPRVVSALVEPGTNQVRFSLSTGITLMYDYYYQQWGTFTGIPNVSSTVYQNLHTLIDSYGRVLQETPGLYADAGNPVLMQFTTGWLQLQKLQGYQRAYYFYILGDFISQHTMQISLAYDYQQPSQIIELTPDNTFGTWGSDPLWGTSTPWGGTGTPERWRVFMDRGKCSSLQISIQEQSTVPGAGFTLSGLNVVIGSKKAYPVLAPSKSVG